MTRQIVNRWLKGVGLLVLLIALAWAGIVLTPWSVGMCGEEPRGEAWSPDGRRLAGSFVRSCGATTGYVTHVNLRRRWSYFNTTWAGTIDQDEVFVNACLSEVKFTWNDSSNLEIEYKRCYREDKRDPAIVKNEQWDGVTITYRESE